MGASRERKKEDGSWSRPQSVAASAEGQDWLARDGSMEEGPWALPWMQKEAMMRRGETLRRCSIDHRGELWVALYRWLSEKAELCQPVLAPCCSRCRRSQMGCCRLVEFPVPVTSQYLSDSLILSCRHLGIATVHVDAALCGTALVDLHGAGTAHRTPALTHSVCRSHRVPPINFPVRGDRRQSLVKVDGGPRSR